jgi:multicomponent Na+:H+ antiporter subunit C
MTVIILAILVGVLFATGTYLILRRGQIKLILGLGLLSHGVNLFLFGSGRLTRGIPPILDKASYTDDLTRIVYADPLPQALILTAIVISFGITAFVVVLVHRRHVIASTDVVYGEYAAFLKSLDPFAQPGVEQEDTIEVDNSYDWQTYELDEVYNRRAGEPQTWSDGEDGDELGEYTEETDNPWH